MVEIKLDELVVEQKIKKIRFNNTFMLQKENKIVQGCNKAKKENKIWDISVIEWIWWKYLFLHFGQVRVSR